MFQSIFSFFKEAQAGIKCTLEHDKVADDVTLEFFRFLKESYTSPIEYRLVSIRLDTLEWKIVFIRGGRIEILDFLY